jgi:hypothetical protein
MFGGRDRDADRVDCTDQFPAVGHPFHFEALGDFPCPHFVGIGYGDEVRTQQACVFFRVPRAHVPNTDDACFDPFAHYRHKVWP